MRLQFTKMHGLGNDFVVLDRVTQRFNIDQELIRKLADRNFGIGCDQVLVVDIPSIPEADFRYRIYNCDGSEVEHCGNGARCFAKFVRDKQLTGKRRINVETATGMIEVRVTRSNQYCVNMGSPWLEPADIPFQADARAPVYSIHVDGQDYDIGAVSMGNPHAVLIVDDVDTAPVHTLGPSIEHHPRFPNRVNAGFMQILGRNHIKLRVFERGVGETLACGTGACAAVVSGNLRGLLDRRVKVELPGGTLNIEWGGEGKSLEMIGPAARVFDGEIHI